LLSREQSGPIITEIEIASARALLGTCGWGSRVPAAMLEALLAEARWRLFQPGETVTLGGSLGGSFHGIGSGQVGVVPTNAEPGTPMMFVMGPGWWWGAAPLSGRSRALDGVARTPSLVCSISLPQIELMLTRNPEWWRFMAMHTQEWLNLTVIAYVDMAVTGNAPRCAAHLLRIAGMRPPLCPSVGEAFQITHEEFGRMVNLSRSTVSTLLKRFDRAGMIELGYRSITIRDPAALARLLEKE